MMHTAESDYKVGCTPRGAFYKFEDLGEIETEFENACLSGVCRGFPKTLKKFIFALLAQDGETGR